MKRPHTNTGISQEELASIEGKIAAILQQIENLTVKKDRDETLSLLIVYLPDGA